MTLFVPDYTLKYVITISWQSEAGGLTLVTVFSSVLWFTFALIVTHCVYTRPTVLTRFGLTLVYISNNKIHQN